MSLTSFDFFAFFIISLFLYYAVPQRGRWVVLLVYSMAFFLLTSTPYTLVYVLVSIVTAHHCAVLIERARTNNAADKAKWTLALGLTINAGILVLLKYSRFLISNVNLVFSLVHISVRLPIPQFAAPLGVSFYTFSVIGYLLDTYWGITEPQQSFWKTALFVGYYPQLTSGPITRYSFSGGVQDYMKTTRSIVKS